MPRPSQAAATEAARAAEFNEKKWVWVPDDKEGYVAGWVHKEDADEGEIILAPGGEMRRVPLGSLSKMNPPKFDRVDDMADLTYLNEASVVHNLRLRYEPGDIYTYSGLFLVAINPYTKLPIYTDATIQQYRGKGRDDNPPHIFAIAEKAWLNMVHQRENQSILITGESGAGKTENTKKVIQYLAAIATQRPTLPRSASSQTNLLSAFKSSISNRLSDQILQTNPILEAFGNAQTARNNNSSRFGKFVRISFNSDGSIAGANIDWYLLEKSRVVIRSEVERSFHVFYQLMAGGGALKEPLLLTGTVSDYEYLNKGRVEVDGVDDKAEFKLLSNALDVVGFSQAEQFDLFRVVAAILHIGNIGVMAIGADSAQLTGTEHEKACHLLGINVGEFGRAVLKPQVLAGREWVTQSRTRAQALNELGALCKTLYERMFGGLVERVNRALERPGPKATFIGVLDIAGFEIFQINGFEQLCINYTNEKLQQFFNHHMFVLEQEEYSREGIEWDYMNFGLDLEPTIALIESSGPTIGILSCLDEECIMPKANDKTFTEKLNGLWTGDAEETGHAPEHLGRAKYCPTRFEQGFIIQHYAGEVEYRTDGWLEKNKDPLNDNLTRLLANSTDRYVSSLFADYKDTPTPGGLNANTFGKRRVLKKGAFRTVSQRHREQLSSLMAQLQATEPHFVRCIVPNGLKRPLKIDVPLVLDQLRCNGVLEGIRIARMGYPNRLLFVEFRQRYELLTPGILPRGYMDGRQACERMLRSLELDHAGFKIGITKIFFKAGVLAELEERRDKLLYEVFSRFQAAARRWSARRQMRKILNRAVALKTLQRNARLYGELRDWPWWQLYTKVRPLLTATRNDEELRRKEAELALARVQAERDQQEREKLEKLRSELEQDQLRIQEDLEAERTLNLDKDALLERSKKRESDLEEDVIALQQDLDTLDSQLDRVMKTSKASEVKYATLKETFDKAAEHLTLLEAEQQQWRQREGELQDDVQKAMREQEASEKQKEEANRHAAELKLLVSQKDQDLRRLKERSDKTIESLDGKLATESRLREQLQGKANASDKELRTMKTQLEELTRTATDYTAMLKRKETDISQLLANMDDLHVEREQSLKHNSELQAHAASLEEQLEVSTAERQREHAARNKLQKEIDELRNVMAAKASEDTRKNEAHRSREKELTSLRAQHSKLGEQLEDVRRSNAESHARMKIELEEATHNRSALEQSQKELLAKQADNVKRREAAEASLADAQRAQRSMESEIRVLKERSVKLEGELAETTKSKESLQRQLVTAQSKYQDFEDAVLQIEREKASWARQMESMRKQLNSESDKRAHLEQSSKNHNAETAKLKDRTGKLEKELNKSLSELHDKDWQVKQLLSKQDKTIVEHVHVLEEAKRRTDRELADLKVEMQSLQGYVRSLEKIRTRLAGEAEDLSRQTEKERQQMRAKEKSVKTAEDKVARAQAEADRERKLREAAEVQVRRHQADVKTMQEEVRQMESQMNHAKNAKANLENELAAFAADGDSTQRAVSEMRRDYEARIAYLESNTQNANISRLVADRVRDRIDRQHKDIRKFIAENTPKGDLFANRLLKALQHADDEVARDFSPSRADRVVSFMDSPSKRKSAAGPNGSSGDSSRRSSMAPSGNKAVDNQSAALRQKVQNLEQQINASDRVRQHLQASMRDLSREMENAGNHQSLQASRARLNRENTRLTELLNDEAEARRKSEASQIDDLKKLWTEFQHTISIERDNYSQLEESRRALLAQQRTMQVELEDNQQQVKELTQSKRQLQAEVTSIKDRLEMEALARNEEANARRRLEIQIQELAASSSTSSTVQTELREAAEMYKAKAESYLARLESTEVEKAKAARTESHARKAIEEAERANALTSTDLKTSEQQLRQTEGRLNQVQAKLDEASRQISDFEIERRRMLEEMEDARDQHQKELSERDFTVDQTRKKYQGELAQSIDEIQSLRDAMSRRLEENHAIRAELDELQLRYDDEVYSGSNWKQEKDRFEARIATLTEAYESSTAKQADAQTQVVSLLSQVRELRAVLDEANAERSALARARKALELRMTDIAQEHLNTSQMSSDRAVQALHVEKQDLRSALEEQSNRALMASERLKKTEAYANESQAELNRMREENAELDRKNTQLGNQVKELNLRIVDFETKSYAVSQISTPARSRRLESRIEELTTKLNQESKEKSETIQMQRDADKSVRDIQLQLTESERQRLKLQEEMRSYESKVLGLRQTVDQLQNSESALQLERRRAERESAEYKQRALSSERELERLKSRLDRPSSLVNSPASSPRKH